MPKSIEVIGLASGKLVKTIEVQHEHEQMSLMDFLRAHKIPVASSCFGEGVCRRCKVNQGLLSCQIKMIDYLKTQPTQVEIDYI